MNRKIAIIILLLVISFSGCKKDGEGSASLDNEYRLTQWKYYENGTFSNRSELKYEVDKLSEINYYNTPSDKNTREMKRRITFTYNGDQVEVMDYDNTASGQQLMAKEIRKYSGNNLTELKEYSSDLSNPDYTTTYEYNDNKLSKKIFKDHLQSKNLTAIYSWKDDRIDKISTTIYHNSFTRYEDEVFSYNGGDVSSIICYIKSDKFFDTTKTSFTYNDDIVSMKFYYRNYGNWDFDWEQTYVLDDYGNTIRIYNGDLSAPLLMEYSYVRNNGNFTKVFLTPDFSFSGLLYPFKK